MPNTGKPSKDCHTCRKRRVKCTLERPECQRCLRIGSKCPGYRDEQDLMFRNEDITSLGGSAATRDRRRARSGNSSERDSSSGNTSELNTPTQLSVPSDWSFRGVKLKDLDPVIFNKGAVPSIFPIPSSRWSHYAVPLVLALFSYEVEGQRIFSQFQILANLLMRCPENSPLSMCCEALGIAYLANRFRSAKADTVRDQAYVRALAATNTLVGDPELCQQDEAPISVWLLSLYEVLAGAQHLTHGSSTVTWSIHAQGQVELLRLRGQGQLETPTGRGVFCLLAMSTQIRTLITAEEYPPFIQEWLTASRDQLSGPNLEFFGLSSFAYDLSDIVTRIREALTTDDTQFLSWTMTDLWTRLLGLQATLDKALRDHALGEPVSLENLHISNLYRTFYVRSLQHMLDLVNSRQARENLPSAQLDRVVFSIHNTVQNLAEAILSSASTVLTSKRDARGSGSSSLGDSLAFNRPVFWCDFLKLLWPLRILRARKQLPSDRQADLAEAMLQCISEDFCIRQAVANYHPLDVPAVA